MGSSHKIGFLLIKSLTITVFFFSFLLLSESLLAEIKNSWLSNQLANMDKSVDVDVDFGYDSNVSVNEIDLITAEGDRFIRLGFGAELEYQPAATNNLNLRYKLSDKRFDDFSDLDIQTHMISTGAEHQFVRWKAGLVYRYIDANLGGDDFLKMSQWAPSVSGFVNKQHFVRLGYVNGRKWFVDNPERNASSNELSLDYYYFLNGIRQYVAVGTKLKHENTSDPQFDYQLRQFRIRYQYRMTLLNLPAQVDLGWRYQRREYDEARTSSINDFRLDKRNHFDAGIEFRLQQRLTAAVETEYRKNSSNLPAADYIERIYTIGLRYQF